MVATIHQTHGGLLGVTIDVDEAKNCRPMDGGRLTPAPQMQCANRSMAQMLGSNFVMLPDKHFDIAADRDRAYAQTPRSTGSRCHDNTSRLQA